MRRSEPMFPPDTTEVVLYDGGIINRSIRLVKVTRVTATQVVLPPIYSHQGERRFDIFTGDERGARRGSVMGMPRITPATQEERERAKWSTALAELRSLTSRVDDVLNGGQLRNKNRTAAELELSLASLKAAYEVLTA